MNGVFGKILIENDVLIGPSASVEFEDPVRLYSGVKVKSFARIGAYTFIRESVLSCDIQIGRYCSIASGCVFGEPNHPIGWMSTGSFQYPTNHFSFSPRLEGFNHCTRTKTNDVTKRKRGISIDDDVWIGTNAIIMRGVHIGVGAVIAAGAVVTSDVEPYSIVGGVPARHIRYRFDKETIDLLMESEWWEYDAGSLSGTPFNDPVASAHQLIKRRKAGEIEPRPRHFSALVLPMHQLPTISEP